MSACTSFRFAFYHPEETYVKLTVMTTNVIAIQYGYVIDFGKRLFARALFVANSQTTFYNKKRWSSSNGYF